jgi:heme/copper-type cytochrome/quinol oxidase subunit 4
MKLNRLTTKNKLILIVFAAFFSLIILFLFNPAKSKIYPPCPFKFLTGYYCPGCGTLRALHQLFHGHLIAAIKLNSLMIFSIPLLLYLLLYKLNIKINGRQLFPNATFPFSFYVILLTIIILYWILRNVPIHPFDYLAPHS